MQETSPEIRWARTKKPCANCPLFSEDSPKAECEHPHRVSVQNIVDHGERIGSVLMCQFWHEGKFAPASGEQRAAVELLSSIPDPDPRYNVAEIY